MLLFRLFTAKEGHRPPPPPNSDSLPPPPKDDSPPPLPDNAIESSAVVEKTTREGELKDRLGTYIRHSPDH